MPGVLGIIPSRGSSRTAPTIENMINSLKHSKEYKVDQYKKESFAIARVHLGIFNPEPQPIFNEDKSLCIFMDGKIYGYKEKILELKQAGHKFKVNNEPEFCLHSYEEYGKKFVKELNGIFLIVIYDFKEESLLIANDRYGLIPHYYAVNNNRFLFAPEIKAIFQDKTFKKELNDEAIANFFAFMEPLGDKTFLKKVKILPPGSILIYEGKEIKTERYWNFRYNSDYSITEEDFANRLVETFKRAVKIRIEDNYRYCVSLSGGLDSRSIIAAIDSKKRKDIYAFTFGPLDSDEVKIAKKVAEKSGTHFLHRDIPPNMIIDNAEENVWLSEGKANIGNSFIYPLHKSIRDIVDVVFDGYELGVLLGGQYSTRKVSGCRNRKALINRLIKRRIFSEEKFKELFTVSYYPKVKERALESFEKEFDKAKSDSLGNECDNFFLSTYTSFSAPIGEVLTRDAIEVSFPTIDNDFIDIILKIPAKFRLNHRIYRKFLKKLSPELAKIPYNKTMVPVDAPLFLWKAGMVYQIGNERIKKLMRRPIKRSYVNFDEWLRVNKRWKDYFRDLLSSKDALSREYFNQKYIEKLIREHEQNKKDNSQKLLYLATFELFLRKFQEK